MYPWSLGEKNYFILPLLEPCRFSIQHATHALSCSYPEHLTTSITYMDGYIHPSEWTLALLDNLRIDMDGVKLDLSNTLDTPFINLL